MMKRNALNHLYKNNRLFIFISILVTKEIVDIEFK